MYGRILFTYFIFISNKSFLQKGRTWAISRYRYYIQRANFRTKTLFYILLLSNFLFKICTSIYHMVLNPVTPKESPFDEQNRLALDRVKSIKSLLGVKRVNYQQKRNSNFALKSCQYFCFKLCYGHYKTRVSRLSDCWINDIKYCRTWIFLHIICLSYTIISRNAG